MLGVGAIPAASAGPVLHVSRSSVDFSHVAANFASPVQPVFITNTGDAVLNLSQLSISGPQAAEFTLAGTCGTPSSLAPGEDCRIDLVMKKTTTQTVLTAESAALAIQSDASPTTKTITLTGVIDPHYGAVPFIVPAPPFVNFGNQEVASTAPPMVLTVFNATSLFNFAIDALEFTGGDAADFSVASPCAIDKKLVTGQTCAISVTFHPQEAGPRSTELLLGLSGTGMTAGAYVAYRYSITGVGRAGPPKQPVTVVEYYNASLNHYFITWIPGEIAILDAGVTIKGWTRTGKSFNTHASPQAGTTAVCRFYIPPEKGNSHFFGRGTAECAATGQKNPTFTLEDPAFMHMYLPAAGNCPPETVEVYRVFSNRPDANHRYMIDSAVRDEMVSHSWLAEGDGPRLVVMCAP